MASRVIYELQGGRGFESDLEKASAEVRQKCERVCRDTALAIMRKAKAAAPDDPATTSGDLKSSITFDGKGLNYKVGIDDRNYPSRGGDTAHQNPSVYGVWYEYGFVTKHIRTTPYMRPAADAEEAGHVERMTEAINSGLKGGA